MEILLFISNIENLKKIINIVFIVVYVAIIGFLIEDIWYYRSLRFIYAKIGYLILAIIIHIAYIKLIFPGL